MKKEINKKIVYPVAFVLIAAGTFIYKSFCLRIRDNNIVFTSARSTSGSSSEVEATTSETAYRISVYICGAVNCPDVYEVSSGAILNDVLQLAGGFTEDADRNNIDLVYIINRNLTVYVPMIGEENYPQGDYLLRQSSGVTQSDVQSQSSDSSLININTASSQELTSLPGIGDSLAGAIVEYRDLNGSFASKEDIMQVSGIGQSKYEQIKELICV